MRITAYLRVSTDAEAEHGRGLDVQRRAIRAWARQHGHKIASWHADEGISAGNGLDTRDALPDAVGEISQGRADGLVVYRLDRVARDLIPQEILLAEIAGLGGQMFSTSAGEQDVITDDPEDPSRRLIRQVLGAVAQYQRSPIRLRLSNDRRHKAERGGHAYGTPPPGPRGDEGEPVEPAEATAVDRILELAATGASTRSIATALTAEGYRPKRGGTWHQETVRRVLARAA